MHFCLAIVLELKIKLGSARDDCLFLEVFW